MKRPLFEACMHADVRRKRFESFCSTTRGGSRNTQRCTSVRARGPAVVGRFEACDENYVGPKPGRRGHQPQTTAQEGSDAKLFQ